MAVYKRRIPKTDKEAWCLDVTWHHPDGRVTRVRRFAQINSRAGAAKEETKVRQALLDGTWETKGDGITLGKFRDEFIRAGKADKLKPRSIKEREAILDNWLIPHLGTHALTDIGSAQIALLKGKLADRAPATINNVLSCLSKLLKTAADAGYLDYAAIPRIKLVKRTKPEVDYLTPDQQVASIQAAGVLGPYHLCAALLMLDCGLRAGEVRGLQRQDVDHQAGTLTVHRAISIHEEVGPPKNGKARTVPLTPRALDAVKAIPASLKGPWVLHQDDGKPITKAMLRTWLQAIERATGQLDRDGQARGKAHRWRHSYGTNLARAGVPGRSIQELMGHSSLAVTGRYMHFAPGSMDDGRDRLVAYLATQGQKTAAGEG